MAGKYPLQVAMAVMDVAHAIGHRLGSDHSKKVFATALAFELERRGWPFIANYRFVSKGGDRTYTVDLAVDGLVYTNIYCQQAPAPPDIRRRMASYLANLDRAIGLVIDFSKEPLKEGLMVIEKDQG